MRKYTKRVAALATAGVVAASGGAAWAFWTISGSGEASAKAGKVISLKVSGSSISALVPGSRSDVKVTVTNENKFPVLITSINFTGFAVVSKTTRNCPNNTVEAVPNAPLPTDLYVAPQSTKVLDYKDSVRMIADPDDACQEADFGFKTTVGGKSTTAPQQDQPPTHNPPKVVQDPADTAAE
ncbi:hypothetical protein [Actinoplanes derwentensis]|uniref:SipW-cognate class signal peptide n=1 Tax=Actinoplanes derwentensis TaxID=113562 RepID=A0A1H2D1V0_9ACTN|nr:hypothetical protein [Actinoplanes derwentensis]GID86835.1 hypothetical protein Ade03nite_57590 [Actinoplanes derwentensis]SDT76740.1 hypothetical protein SAMN04489716_7717 [Actinoplanes derwentensis]